LAIVIEDGSCWVTDQQGDRHVLNAPSVVAWETGEWVQYGLEGPGMIRDYRALGRLPTAL
jgi:hypothetical protein